MVANQTAFFMNETFPPLDGPHMDFHRFLATQAYDSLLFADQAKSFPAASLAQSRYNDLTSSFPEYYDSHSPELMHELKVLKMQGVIGSYATKGLMDLVNQTPKTSHINMSDSGLMQANIIGL